jgi:pimeloyl-ACP methyl ester carboxylesterase
MKEFFWPERGIHYRINEWEKNRVTLVFIHGILGSLSAWWQFEKLFDSSYNLLSIDLPGYGKSLKPNEYGAYQIEQTAENVNALMDILDVTSYIPISASAGTIVSLALLRRRPEGATRAIFMSSMFGMNNAPLAKLTKTIVGGIVRLLTFFSYSSKAGTHIDYEKYKTTGDWSLRRLSADIPDNTVRVFLYSLNHLLSRNFDHWWAELSIPAYVIHGTNDSINPVKNVRSLSSIQPLVTMHYIEGGDHIMPLNRFEDVKIAISNYLENKN